MQNFKMILLTVAWLFVEIHVILVFAWAMEYFNMNQFLHHYCGVLILAASFIGLVTTLGYISYIYILILLKIADS